MESGDKFPLLLETSSYFAASYFCPTSHVHNKAAPVCKKFRLFSSPMLVLLLMVVVRLVEVLVMVEVVMVIIVMVVVVVVVVEVRVPNI